MSPGRCIQSTQIQLFKVLIHILVSFREVRMKRSWNGFKETITFTTLSVCVLTGCHYPVSHMNTGRDVESRVFFHIYRFSPEIKNADTRELVAKLSFSNWSSLPVKLKAHESWCFASLWHLTYLLAPHQSHSLHFLGHVKWWGIIKYQLCVYTYV